MMKEKQLFCYFFFILARFHDCHRCHRFVIVGETKKKMKIPVIDMKDMRGNRYDPLPYCVRMIGGAWGKKKK